MGVKQLYKNIDAGKKGRNIGISTGIPKLDDVIYGIQRRYLLTIGADTGGGKTSFSLDVFLYNLIKNKGEKSVAVLYYSFEMASEVLFAKILSRYIWDEFQVIITFKDILSLTETISDEKLEIVYKAKSWLEEAAKYITIYDKALTPNGIYATCKEWLKQFGDFTSYEEHKESYTEKNSSQYKIVLIDHVGLIGGTGSKKERIDLTADYMIHFRNKCNITGIFIQQLNRGAKGMDRKLNGYELIQLDDFKDTSGTTDASEVVIGLYYPYREKIASCEGYPIKNCLRSRFRLCQIIKNRYGDADKSFGLNFFGEINMFKGMPKPSEIEDYTPYLELQKTKNIIDNEIQTKDESNNEIFKF